MSSHQTVTYLMAPSSFFAGLILPLMLDAIFDSWLFTSFCAPAFQGFVHFQFGPLLVAAENTVE